ncbi:MAG: adenylate/guanylate cyclase domain-containing protein [Chloroflexota bacterium]
MICESCGTENRAGRRFCRSCGNAMAALCPACGSPAEPGDRFCGTCGNPLTAETGVAAADGPSAGPGPDAGPSGAGASTERRVVSVLFADLVGFTALSADRDPEAVREFLDGYFALARERIGRYGGTIEKFIGDAVMAVWGTPVAHEDDAERAVRAALDLLDAIAELRAPDGSAIAVRGAVLTGEAAVAIGRDGQAMVAGDLVNTASRLQSVAPPGSVLVGEATVNASESAIVYEPAGDQLLRGKELPVSAWRAVRVVAGRGGFGRTTRLEAPFVGRDDELRLLKELLHVTARDRRARLVSILGIAGIGKSRLAWELEKYIDGLVEVVYWHQGRSPAYGDGVAFWALGEMIRGRARIAESDPPDIARVKLATMAEEYLPDPDERTRVEPRLATLLGLGGESAGSAEELTAAWRTLFERIADRGTTVLVFEDLHWADAGLLDFIESLLSASRNRPILVIALARPELIEDRPGFGATLRNHTRLDLAPLTDEAMDMLLLGLVPGIPQAALRTIRDRAAGIPLYAVETVRMLLDQGRLSESEGRFRLVSDLGSLAVPESLQALLGARLDTLDEPARELVEIAAVLGLSFTVDALVALSDRQEAEVRRRLDGLVAREVFQFDDDPSSPERGQFQFIQGVLREVAYTRLARRERLARHLAAANYYETRAGEELAGIVACHYQDALNSAPDDADRSELAVQAGTALEAAANRSTAIGAHASAAGYLGDAAKLTTDEAERSRLNEMRSNALGAAGQLDEAGNLARELVELGRLRGDRGLEARAAISLTAALLGSGRPADARREAEAVRASLGPFADEEPDGIRLTAEVARAQLMSGDHGAALELIEATLPIAERLGLREVMAQLLPSWGWALNGDGRPIEALAVLRGALAFAEREGLFEAEMRSRMNLSSFAVRESPAEALEVAWTGSVHARERGYIGWSNSAAGNVASCARPLGEWDRIESIGSELDSLGDWLSPWDFAVPAEICIIRAYRGRAAEARDLIERFERQFGDMSDPQIQVTLILLRESMALAEGDLAESIRASREAQRLLDQLGTEDLFSEALAAAVEALDAERVGEVADAIRRGGAAGRVSGAVLTAASGALRVLDGDRSALEELDRAADVLRQEGVRFALALIRRARVMLAPEDAGADAAAAEARAILTDLGAVTMLRGLPAPSVVMREDEPTGAQTAHASTDPGTAGVAPG